MYISLHNPCTRLQLCLTLYFFARSINNAVFNDFLIYTSCKSMFGLSEPKCDSLHINSTSDDVLEIERLVQPEVSEILAVQSGIEAALPVIIVLFLGSWSDLHGRKPVLVHVHLGSLLHAIGIAIVSLTRANPWFVIIASMPVSLTGGVSVMLIASYTYMCDITELSNRSWQLSCLTILSCIGILLGDIIGPILYVTGSYLFVFMTTAVFYCIACFFMIYLVPESLPNKKIKSPTTALEMCHMYFKLFNVTLVKDSFTAVIKKREGMDLGVCWMCLLCILLCTFADKGETTIKYLFTNARLGWDISQFANYSIAGDLIIWIFGVYLGSKILTPVMGSSELLTCAVFNVSSFADMLAKSLAWKSWHMYLSLILGVFRGCAKPALRSILSTAVPVHDIGKVFALSTSLEILVGFVSTFLFGLIYSYTMPPIYPSPVWLVAAGAYLIAALLLISLHIKRNKH